MTVVSFVDYVPLERFDGHPFTKVRIEEAVADTGPWDEIDLITFGVPDADPANPVSRSFTTENANLDRGWYRVTFIDANDDQEAPTQPIYYRPNLAEPFLPLVSDVGAILRSRTKDPEGNELGTFTNVTRPTADQVRWLIDQAARQIAGKVDYDLPPEVYPEAKAVIALYTVLLVELSYFPEQIPVGRSAYDKYKELYDEALAVLVEAVAREQNEEVGGEDAGTQHFADRFPVDAGGLIGWQSRW